MDKVNNDKLELCKKKFKVKNRKIIKEYREGYLGKKVYSIELEDGSKRTVEQLTKKGGNGDAVVLIPVDSENNFVMVVESRPNTDEEVEIAFPAGMIDPGEEPIVSAKRELFEETGLIAEEVEELEWHYQDQGCSNAKIYTFLCKGCKRVTNKIGEGAERLDYIVMSYEDVKDLINKNIISSANSKIAFYIYKEMNFK